MRSSPRSEGLVALVTGASRGIGAAVAERLALDGMAVGVTARTRHEEPGAKLPGSLAATVERIEAAGGQASAIVADLSDEADRARIVPEAESLLGPVDVLVNNAAAAMYMPIADFPLRRRRLLFELNVHAPTDLAQAVIPGMRARRRGWIVNISSATSRHPQGPPFDRGVKLSWTTSVYGATKAALERLTTGLAAELHEDNVAVNSIAPVAAVRTPGAEMLVADVMASRPEMVEPIEDIVEAALALATCDPRTCTGRILYSGPLLEELGRERRRVGGSR